MNKKKKLLVLYTINRKIASLSYVYGYPAALKNSDMFEVTACNFGHPSFLRKLQRIQASKKTFDAVLMLHTGSHAMYEFWSESLAKLGAPIVWFIGNEFRGMPSKMAFAREMNISMLVSQSLDGAVLQKYRDELQCDVIGLPVSGFDQRLFPPGPPLSERRIDIGYRGSRGPAWLGHWEREDIASAIREAASSTDLKLDLSVEPQDRLPLKKWRKFLQSSKVQLCVAPGGEVFELTDATRLSMENLLSKHPDATRLEQLEMLPPKENRVRIRTLGSRTVEAAATLTPQIMYRDHFDGPMEPDKHYIALEKDHSNIQDVLDRIKDHKFLDVIAENCARDLEKEASYVVLLQQLDRALDNII